MEYLRRRVRALDWPTGTDSTATDELKSSPDAYAETLNNVKRI